MEPIAKRCRRMARAMLRGEDGKTHMTTDTCSALEQPDGTFTAVAHCSGIGTRTVPGPFATAEAALQAAQALLEAMVAEREERESKDAEEMASAWRETE